MQWLKDILQPKRTVNDTSHGEHPGSPLIKERIYLFTLAQQGAEKRIEMIKRQKKENYNPQLDTDLFWAERALKDLTDALNALIDYKNGITPRDRYIERTNIGRAS